jgi:hypothetical protein
MPSENELVEKIVTTHTSPSIAELVNMKFLSLWIQDIADQMELAERAFADLRRKDIIDAWADWENDCERDRKYCDYDPID